MEEESWEVEKIVNDRILLISSAANIRRKEMQSRSKESAKSPEPTGGPISIEEAKKHIKASMEKDKRGIKKRNLKRAVDSLEKWETSGMWKQIIQEGNEASDRLADTIHLLHVPHAPTSLQSETQPPPGFKRRIYDARGGSHIYKTLLGVSTQLHTMVKRFGRNLSSMTTEITILQCDHLQPCKKSLLITCAKINYKG